MKHLTTLLLLAVTVSMVVSCGRTDTGSKKAKLKEGKMETVSFEVSALGNYMYAGPDTLPDPKCVEPLDMWRVIVNGKGTGTPTGDFTVHFDFCGDSSGNYGNIYAYMVSAEDDTLLFTTRGRVIEGRMDDHPDYVVSYWRDTVIFLGGTGRYEGAYGSAVTDDYNSSEDVNSHHHWKGTITLMNEKQ